MLVRVTSPLDEFRDKLDSQMASIEPLDLETVEFTDNSGLDVYTFRQFSTSHARYILSTLKSDGTLDRVTESLEPIGLRARATKKISTGLLSSHTHSTDVYVLNIDRMEQLAAGDDPPPRMSEFDAEVLAQFCDPDHESAIEHYWKLEEWFRRVDSY